MSLSDFELLLPYRDWKDRDWPQAIRDAQGLTKRILQIQERAVHAIAGVNDGPTTPEKLAWSILWVRGFLLLQAALDLNGDWSVRIADPLYRMAFELWMQVSAIRDPWERLNALRKSDSSVSIADSALDRGWVEVADRLRGFAAWGLTNDLVYHRRRIHRSELDAIYAPTDPSTLPKEPADQAIHTYLYGEQDVVSVAEAAHDRRKARESHEKVIQRINGWLADDVFGVWTKVKLGPWIKGSTKERVPTLFELFDGTRTVLAMLREMQAGYLYASYERGSMLIHGSSIEHFTDTSPESKRILPRLFTSDADGERLCDGLADMCNHALLGLWGMRDRCIPNQPRHD